MSFSCSADAMHKNPTQQKMTKITILLWFFNKSCFDYIEFSILRAKQTQLTDSFKNTEFSNKQFTNYWIPPKNIQIIDKQIKTEKLFFWPLKCEGKFYCQTKAQSLCLKKIKQTTLQVIIC